MEIKSKWFAGGILLLVLLAGLYLTFPKDFHGTGSTDNSLERFTRTQLEATSLAFSFYQKDYSKLPSLEHWRDEISAYVNDSSGIDPWSNPIQYYYDESTEQYFLRSLGSDGKIGGANASADIVVSVRQASDP